MKIDTKEELKAAIEDYFQKYATSEPPQCWDDFSLWIKDLHDIVDWTYMKNEKSDD